MDAKRALTDADGDFEAAVQILREKGLAKAAKRTDRENSEGVIAIASDENGVALVQLKSETDFAAKSPEFNKFAQTLVEVVLADGESGVDSKASELEDLKLIVKENIEIGQVLRYESSDVAVLDAYLHGGGQAGVLIEAEDVDAEVLHEIAMHVAFAKPAYLTRDEVPAEEIEKERAALLEITKSEGKPEQVWDKIVDGRVSAWLGDRVLLEQGVFGEKEKVSAKIGSGTITRFAFVKVGA